jgi:hypothetical protein
METYVLSQFLVLWTTFCSSTVAQLSQGSYWRSDLDQKITLLFQQVEETAKYGWDEAYALLR